MKYLYIILLILPFIGFGQSQKISKTDFISKLENNEVERIIIVNNEFVEVFIKKSILQKKRHQKGVNYSGPHYHFNIFNVEQFENHLRTIRQNNNTLDFYTDVEMRKDIFGDILSWVLPLLILFIIPWMIIPWIKIYKKTNNPGWSFLIPFYNILIYLKIIEKPWYWIFLFFIPVVNVIFHIWGLHLLSRKFGKELGFTFGLVFLPFIFLPILGFDNSKYK